jgi:hypothetical protein
MFGIQQPQQLQELARTGRAAKPISALVSEDDRQTTQDDDSPPPLPPEEPEENPQPEHAPQNLADTLATAAVVAQHITALQQQTTHREGGEGTDSNSPRTGQSASATAQGEASIEFRCGSCGQFKTNCKCRTAVQYTVVGGISFVAGAGLAKLCCTIQ